MSFRKLLVLFRVCNEVSLFCCCLSEWKAFFSRSLNSIVKSLISIIDFYIFKFFLIFWYDIIVEIVVIIDDFLDKFDVSDIFDFER